MTISLYLWGMRLITLFSFLALGTVILKVDPESSGLTGVILFYVVLFLALAGTFILFLTWLRRKVVKNEKTDLSYLSMSFRQGLLISVLIVGLLFLQSFRWLVWWDGLLFLAGIFLIELYFLSKN